jgi:hypothetical protein
VALAVLFSLIQFIFLEYSEWKPKPYLPTTGGISALLSALIVIPFARRNPGRWTRYMGILYSSLLLAVCAGLLGFLTIVAFFGLSKIPCIWGTLAAMAIGLLIGVWGSRRKIWRCAVLSGAVLMAAFALLFALAERQKSVIQRFEREWKAAGISMILSEIFPMPYSKPRCDTWFNSMTQLVPKEGGKEGQPYDMQFSVEWEQSGPKEVLMPLSPDTAMEETEIYEWQPFFDEVILPLGSKMNVKALAKGEDLKAALLAHHGSADPRWTQYKTLAQEIRSCMESCSHVQWFDPMEYKDRIWNIPIPNLLALIRWSRYQLALSQVEAAQGRLEEARAALLPIHRGAQKMFIKGQTLIGILIGIAMEKLRLVGEAGVMAISGEPLPEDIRKSVEEASLQDISWFADSWRAELFATLAKLKEMPPKDYWISLPARTPFRKTILRAITGRDTMNYLGNMTSLLEKIHQAYDPTGGRFGWAAVRAVPVKPSIMFTENIVDSSYGRALSMLTQARLILMMDEILKYRKEHHALPENMDFVQAPWRMDPFNEKPLSYRKENDLRFSIWSVGPDMRDDGAANLYVAGVMEFKDEKKEDIGFRVALAGE